MPSVEYPARIIADAGFINWLIEKDKLKFLCLTHIKSSSIDAKNEHNIIIEEDIKDILKTKKIKEDTLRSAFKGKIIPSQISDEIIDRIDQRIIYAINLATKRPFKTYIFTTKLDEDKYKSSLHYQGVKSITIKSETDALLIIENFWNIFKIKRNICH